MELWQCWATRSSPQVHRTSSSRCATLYRILGLFFKSILQRWNGKEERQDNLKCPTTGGGWQHARRLQRGGTALRRSEGPRHQALHAASGALQGLATPQDAQPVGHSAPDLLRGLVALCLTRKCDRHPLARARRRSRAARARQVWSATAGGEAPSRRRPRPSPRTAADT